jgi:hypothetical protein
MGLEFDFSMFEVIREHTPEETYQSCKRGWEAMRSGTAVVHRLGLDPWEDVESAHAEGKCVFYELPEEEPDGSNGKR